jgi:hypothetical protein
MTPQMKTLLLSFLMINVVAGAAHAASYSYRCSDEQDQVLSLEVSEYNLRLGSYFAERVAIRSERSPVVYRGRAKDVEYRVLISRSLLRLKNNFNRPARGSVEFQLGNNAPQRFRCIQLPK